MTQIEYIDFIRNSLPGEDKTSRYHRNQVKMAINEAVNTVFYEVYKANPKRFLQGMERYSTIISATCVNSTWQDRYETVLTVDVVDLPRKTGGVLEVLRNGLVGTSNHTTALVPVTTMEGEMFYGSEASLTGEVSGFSYSGNRRIEYWNLSDTTVSNGVKIRLIQQFKSYDEDDEVLMPYGQNSRILQLVREYLGLTPPKDLINNNTNSNG